MYLSVHSSLCFARPVPSLVNSGYRFRCAVGLSKHTPRIHQGEAIVSTLWNWLEITHRSSTTTPASQWEYRPHRLSRRVSFVTLYCAGAGDQSIKAAHSRYKKQYDKRSKVVDMRGLLFISPKKRRERYKNYRDLEEAPSVSSAVMIQTWLQIHPSRVCPCPNALPLDFTGMEAWGRAPEECPVGSKGYSKIRSSNEMTHKVRRTKYLPIRVILNLIPIPKTWFLPLMIRVLLKPNQVVPYEIASPLVIPWGLGLTPQRDLHSVSSGRA